MQKILLIKRGALGDILMTTPLIRLLANAGYSIDYLLSESCVGALHQNKFINNLIPVPEYYFSPSKLTKFISCVKKLQKYDYIFVLDKHWYFTFLAIFIKSGQRIGFCRDLISKLFLDRYVSYNNVNIYQVDYYLSLATKIGVSYENVDEKLYLQINDDDVNFVNQFIIEQNISDFAIIVNSGGNNKFENSGIRMLPRDVVIKLIDEVATNYNKVLLLGSSVDFENYQEYINFASADNVINVANFFSLAQSAYLINKSNKFYTTDCGAMHLGLLDGSDIEMVAFFGPSNPSHIVPSLPRIKVIWFDQDIYDQDYQLYGKRRNKQQYFTKFNNIDL